MICHGSLLTYVWRKCMDDFGIVNLLTSVLDRIYSIIDCLPVDLQTIMAEVGTNVSIVYNQVSGIDYIVDSEKEYYDFLDKVTLYQELSYMSRDLGICMLILSNNVKLEDAYFNINLIIEKMAEQDCVFRYCYNNGKMKVLK